MLALKTVNCAARVAQLFGKSHEVVGLTRGASRAGAQTTVGVRARLASSLTCDVESILALLANVVGTTGAVGLGATLADRETDAGKKKSVCKYVRAEHMWLWL